MPDQHADILILDEAASIPEEPCYQARDGQILPALHSLSLERQLVLEEHFQGCMEKTDDCNLCYELYSNLGGQACIDLITSAPKFGDLRAFDSPEP